MAAIKVRITKWRALLAVVVLWLLWGPLYCVMTAIPLGAPVHLKETPSPCAILSVPQSWRLPSNDSDDPIRYSFRRSKRDNEIFIANCFRTEGGADHPPGCSENKYAFRLPQLTGSSRGKISGVRRISEEEWTTGATLPPGFADPGGLALNRPGMVSGYWMWGSDLDPVRYKDPVHGESKQFQKSEDHYGPFSVRISEGGQRLAVFSYGGRKREGAASPFSIPRPWLPRWQRYSIDLYEFSTEKSLGTVQAGCCTEAFRTAEWHGDAILASPLNRSATEVLVCAFK